MKKTLLIILSVVLLGVIAGCTSDEGKEKNEGEGGGEFTFASSGLYPPFNYSDNDKLVGFDIEIGNAIAEELGKTPKAVTNPWQTIIAALQANKFDAIIGSMAITDERLKEVNFTVPYYESGAQVFVKEDNDDIKSENDLKGKKIGVVVSSTFESTAKEYTDEVSTYDSDVTALQDLLVKGRLDAVITERLVGMYAINKNDLKIKLMGEPLYLEQIGIAISKEDDQLVEDINKALETLVENGTYAEISEKYFGVDITK